MVWALGVGGPRLDVAGGGWDAWPIVGLVVVLWLGRRVFALPWRAPLLIASIAGSLVLPLCVHAWGVMPTAAIILVGTLVLRLGRAAGSAKRNDAV
jgi:hypothetical protein